MNQKGFANIVLVVVVIVLVGIVGYFALRKPSSAPSTQVAPSVTNQISQTPESVTTSNAPQDQNLSSPNSNWKKYRNEQYGFEIMYSPQTSGNPIWEVPDSNGKNFAISYAELGANLQINIFPSASCTSYAPEKSTSQKVGNVTFSVTDVSNLRSTPRTQVTASSYCATHLGTSYELVLLGKQLFASQIISTFKFTK